MFSSKHPWQLNHLLQSTMQNSMSTYYSQQFNWVVFASLTAYFNLQLTSIPRIAHELLIFVLYDWSWIFQYLYQFLCIWILSFIFAPFGSILHDLLFPARGISSPKIETSRVQWENFLNRSHLHNVSKPSESSFASDTAWVSVVSSNTSSSPIQHSLKSLAKPPEIFADKPRTKSPIKLRTTSNWKLWASSFPSSVPVIVSRHLNTPGALEFPWWLRPLTQTTLYVKKEIEWSWLAKDV